MPTPFARQTEQALLQITFSQHGDSYSRQYRLTHNQRKNTRRMLQEDSR